MDEARRRYHEVRLGAERALVEALVFRHRPVARPGRDPWCSRCGASLASPLEIVRPCPMAPRCDECGSLGVVRTVVRWDEVAPGTWRPTEDRIPCSKCYPLFARLDAEYWDTVRDQLWELNHPPRKDRSRPTPPEVVGVG